MRLFSLLSFVFFLTACSDPTFSGRDSGGDDSGISFDANLADTSGYDTNLPDVPLEDGSSGSCLNENARWVYVVDLNNRLLRFRPDALAFDSIGTLNCPSGNATPFSMSVDRNATAWVLHNDGRLYQVSTSNASCSATDFVPNQQGFRLFGMGFVGEGDDRASEMLYIAGGEGPNSSSGTHLGTIDMSNFVLTPQGSRLVGSPELTGNAAGELWAFSPDTSPPSVSEINRTTGRADQTFAVNAIQQRAPRAWAFAFWGGKFYIFLQQQGDPSTNVYELDPATGASTQVLTNTGYTIVGAGVSICAPTTLM